MHWTPLSSLGAATIAFYAPILLLTGCLLSHYGLPRMTWLFLVLMAAIRVSSGVLLILHESNTKYHIGLETWTSIMLGLGIFLLLFAFVEWFQIIDAINASKSRRYLRPCLIAIRFVGVVALAIFIAGSILRDSLDQKPVDLKAGAVLDKAGAILAVSMLASCAGLLLVLWAESIKRKICSGATSVILSVLSLSALLLILRVIYMCLEMFHGGAQSIWNPLTGSLDALVRMSLLPEYVVVVVMVVTGVWMLRLRTVGKPSTEGVPI